MVDRNIRIQYMNSMRRSVYGLYWNQIHLLEVPLRYSLRDEPAILLPKNNNYCWLVNNITSLVIDNRWCGPQDNG